jgi:MFS family permease
MVRFPAAAVNHKKLDLTKRRRRVAFLMADPIQSETKSIPKSGFYYGWVIVVVCLLLLTLDYGLYSFGTQIVMVHLVNYATDSGLTPMKAAALMSTLGAVSILGRLVTGWIGDKMDIVTLMLIPAAVHVLCFLFLLFARQQFSLYFFAAFFGLAYGAEVLATPMLTKRYFGTKRMATLVGLFFLAGLIGGACGPIVGGKLFDATKSYQTTFIVGAVVVAIASIPLFAMKARDRRALTAQAAPAGD